MDVGLVCDGCRTFNAMGARSCVRCSAALSLDPAGRASTASGLTASTSVARAVLAAVDTPPPRARAEAPATEPSNPVVASSASARACATCGNPVPVGNRFCGACGTPTVVAPPASAAPRVAAEGTSKKTLFFGAMQGNHTKLVVIKGDGLDGVSYTLAGAEHPVGRGDVAIAFDEDPFLSPLHANFLQRDGKLAVRDEDSANGVYIRIRGTTPCAYGDRVLIGEQLLELSAAGGEGGPHPDGTFFYASPRRAAHFRLLQLLRGGAKGMAHEARGDVVSIGREGNDVDFPDDPFISGRHAQVTFAGGGLTLTDLGSKNGTFLRIRSETLLEHGDYVFMGQQLLRVEIV